MNKLSESIYTHINHVDHTNFLRYYQAITSKTIFKACQVLIGFNQIDSQARHPK